jgi:uncharacterized protein
MKWKVLLMLALAVVVTIGLAGCSTVGAQAPTSGSSSSQQGIWVNGQGTVLVTPNIASLNLGVTVQAAKVADAQSQAASNMSKVIAALTGNGVDQKDISTRYYTINQVTRYDNSTQQSVITGYQVSNTVNVIIRSIDKVGPIIDAVAAAGGDATRINSISFSVDNPDQYNSQARTLAMNDAKAKATQLASLAGLTLGKVFFVEENSSSTPIPYNAAVPTVAVSSPSTPINPGQISITLNVQVAYAAQ